MYAILCAKVTHLCANFNLWAIIKHSGVFSLDILVFEAKMIAWFTFKKRRA